MPYLSGRTRNPGSGDEGSSKGLGEKQHDIDIIKLQKAHEQLTDMHREIRESHIEMIFNLAIAAEYKDPDTGNHILRISDYSTEIAGMLGMPEAEIDHLRYAAPMHDIGKIGIPDKILQKPGKLTPEEWTFMKTHTTIGARMFHSSKSALLRAAAEIALTHHEKYDGSGYPRGLKGKDIPVFGRIIAIADVFDALVSKRCYKEAHKLEDALDFIEKAAGSHLDPDIVKLFLKNQGQIRRIYDANRRIQEYIQETGEITGAKQDIEL